LVELECERTLSGWVPRRLGGGFGGRKEAGQLRFGGHDRPFRKPIFVHPPNRTELQHSDFSTGKERVHNAIDNFRKQSSEEKYDRPHISQSTSGVIAHADSRNRQKSKRREADDEYYRSESNRSRKHNSSDDETKKRKIQHR